MSTGPKCNAKLAKVNLQEHVRAHDNFSSQNKFLPSNFLYSLDTQKPHLEGAGSERCIAVAVCVIFIASLAGDFLWGAGGGGSVQSMILVLQIFPVLGLFMCKRDTNAVCFLVHFLIVHCISTRNIHSNG